MRYLMKQEWLSFGDDFIIQDEHGEDVFWVEGRVFSLGDQLSFKDAAGNELAFIRQRLLSWGPAYEIFKDGQLHAVVTKELFSFFNCRFHVDVDGPDDLQAEGDFLDHEYVFSRAAGEVAMVSKQWFAWTDTYGIEVNDDQDAVMILAAAVVIDMACHQKK